MAGGQSPLSPQHITKAQLGVAVRASPDTTHAAQQSASFVGAAGSVQEASGNGDAKLGAARHLRANNRAARRKLRAQSRWRAGFRWQALRPSVASRTGTSFRDPRHPQETRPRRIARRDTELMSVPERRLCTGSTQAPRYEHRGERGERRDPTIRHDSLIVCACYERSASRMSAAVADLSDGSARPLMRTRADTVH